MENGATYELRIEERNSVHSGVSFYHRVTSRTHMEIKIETTQ